MITIKYKFQIIVPAHMEITPRLSLTGNKYKTAEIN
jgi:hypothetical protein